MRDGVMVIDQVDQPRSVVKAFAGDEMPEDGLWSDVPEHLYHSWPGVSASKLKHLEFSPAHLKASIEQPSDPTSAMVLGRAVHAAILEPEKFDREYTFLPASVNLRTNAGKEARAELEVKFGPHNVLREEDFELVLSLRSAVESHVAASALASAVEHREVTGVWHDPRTGVLCRMRIDGLSLSRRFAIDLKTTGRGKAVPGQFQRTIADFDYHRQAAMYLDGLRALGFEADKFVFIAIEKESPFGIRVYELAEEAIAIGRAQIRNLLDLCHQCEQSGKWPGYPQTIETISLPSWAMQH